MRFGYVEFVERVLELAGLTRTQNMEEYESLRYRRAYAMSDVGGRTVVVGQQIATAAIAGPRGTCSLA